MNDELSEGIMIRRRLRNNYLKNLDRRKQKALYTTAKSLCITIEKVKREFGRNAKKKVL